MMSEARLSDLEFGVSVAALQCELCSQFLREVQHSESEKSMPSVVTLLTQSEVELKRLFDKVRICQPVV